MKCIIGQYQKEEQEGALGNNCVGNQIELDYI